MTSPTHKQGRSGWRILIAGTGGQGALTAARLLCDCLVERGHSVVSGQLHGMAQRGGAVQSSVIIDGGVSPVIQDGQADFVMGLEPVETARAMPFMSRHTVVYMNTSPVIPFVVAQRTVLKEGGVEYPDVGGLCEAVQAIAPRTSCFDATKSALEAGAIQALNMVLLGCLLGSGSLPCSAEEFWNTAVKRIPSALQATNTRAFRRGAEFAKELLVSGEAL
jgi:indolepyruvate ferredoxin oxidoreductase beta subunit